MLKKDTIRRQVIELRKHLDKGYIDKYSKAIANRLFNTLAYQKAEVIMAYVSLKGEVDTEILLRQCLIDEKVLTVPLIKGMAHMEAAFIKNPDIDLVIGEYGIYAPNSNAKIIDPKNIDLIVVPGLAFDRKKHRIGFGKGYYDRFLVRLKESCIKIALAFEFQIFDKIPFEEHDIPMDMVITDTEII